MIILFAFLQGVLYASTVPPWLAPDEHGHFEYTALMVQLERIPGVEDRSPALEQEIIASMRANNMWRLAWRHPAPVPGLQEFSEDVDLSQSGRQIGNEPPLYYALLTPPYLLTRDQPVETQLYAMRLTSVFILTVTIAIACRAARDLFPKNTSLQLLVPGIIAFQPMFTYIGSAVNSDILGVLVATFAFWMVIRLFRYGFRWSCILILAACVPFALFTSQQVLFLIPLIALIFLSWIYIRISSPWVNVSILMFSGLVLLTLSILTFLSSSSAQGWIIQPTFHLADTASEVACTGKRSFVVPSSRNQPLELLQRISDFERLQGETVVFKARVLSDSERGTGSLFVRDNHGITRRSFCSSDEWTDVEFVQSIAEDARFLSVGVINDSNQSRLYVDDLSLKISDGSQEQLLFNHSAEAQASMLQQFLADGVYLTNGLPWNFHLSFFDVSFDVEALQWYKQRVKTLFRTFWGAFVYLAVQLPEAWYTVIAAAMGLALIGWVRSFALRYTASSFGDLLTSKQWRIIGVLGLGAGIDLFLILLTILFMPTHWWQPQGRYLFPLLLPLGIFLGVGWLSLIPSRVRSLFSMIVVLSGYVFNLTCLYVLIVPYCYA